MDESESLSHSRWECKYHVVFIPKCRRRTLYEQLRRHLGEVFRKLAEHKESQILEGHLMPDHVHMLIASPPKYAVSQVVGYIKGIGESRVARDSVRGLLHRTDSLLATDCSAPVRPAPGGGCATRSLLRSGSGYAIALRE